mgnify:CR=1 FL=1
MDNPFEIIMQQNTEIIKHLQELKIFSVTTLPITEGTPEQDQNLSYDELSAYLKKNKSTIHRYKKNGVFPYYQAGRTVFFKKSEVDIAMSSMTPIKKNSKGVKTHG